MLPIAKELRISLSLPADQRTYVHIQSMVNTILKCGTKEDADLLLEAYCNQPFDFYHNLLLPIFRKFGDTGFAEKLYSTAVTNHQLHPDADPDVLEVLGYLKYKPSKDLLHRYGFSEGGTDYYLQKGAHLGLLHFDCGEYLDEIRDGIEACFNKNLFPEFLPALVCKLPARESYLEKLYELGDQHASTDCNAGIILGFSLCGDEGQPFFLRALFNPHWEAWSGSTGSVGYAYRGIKNLNLSFQELYSALKNSKDDAELRYGLTVLLSLLEERLRDYDDEAVDNFRMLYEQFFGKDTDNLTDLAERIGRTADVSPVQTLLKLKMTEEMMPGGKV
jgi:hypothetical protein